MIKLYIHKKLPRYPLNRLYEIINSTEGVCGPLFQTVNVSAFKEFIKLTNTIAEADFILIPHDLSKLGHENKYLNEVSILSKKYKKLILGYSYTDDEKVPTMENIVVLKSNGYRSELKDNEYIVAAFVEDIGLEYGHEPRNKMSRPVVGFAGRVGYDSFKKNAKHQAKILRDRIKCALGMSEAKINGIYFRRKALDVLRGSQDIELIEVGRTSYSANLKSIKGEVNDVRTSFVNVIKQSDFPLVVRGDGNYSLRFFEVLSLGRVPLLIDTDTPLPFEDEIDYDSFILRVDHRAISTLPEIVTEYWHKISNEDFHAMQSKARQTYVSVLAPAIFYKKLFQKLSKFIS